MEIKATLLLRKGNFEINSKVQVCFKYIAFTDILLLTADQDVWNSVSQITVHPPITLHTHLWRCVCMKKLIYIKKTYMVNQNDLCLWAKQISKNDTILLYVTNVCMCMHYVETDKYWIIHLHAIFYEPTSLERTTLSSTSFSFFKTQYIFPW